jgi:hypothetical protein
MGLVSILLAIAYLTESFPETQLLVAIVLTAGIIFPLLIILTAYLAWLHKRSARSRAFSKTPFNQIEKIGFYKSHSNVKTKWFFTEEVKEGKFNDFIFVLDVCKENNHIIELEAPIEWKKLDRSKYNRLSEKFRQHGIEFRIGSLVKRYNTKRPTVHTIYDLKNDLHLFTVLLREEGFEPRKE